MPSGSRTSPTSQPGPASSTSPSSSTPTPVASWAGVSHGPHMRASCSMRWSRPSMIGGPSIAAGSYITATAAAKVDSSGRRNTVFVGLWNPLVKRLCGRFPAERLSGSGIEGSGHCGDLLGAVHAQIGTFREVLAQQPVGVLVGAALPRTLRIAEVDLHASVDLQAGVLGHLGPLIPGQRPAELLG